MSHNTSGAWYRSPGKKGYKKLVEEYEAIEMQPMGSSGGSSPGGKCRQSSTSSGGSRSPSGGTLNQTVRSMASSVSSRASLTTRRVRGYWYRFEGWFSRLSYNGKLVVASVIGVILLLFLFALVKLFVGRGSKPGK